jgi:hypothetical protein
VIASRGVASIGWSFLSTASPPPAWPAGRVNEDGTYAGGAADRHARLSRNSARSFTSVRFRGRMGNGSPGAIAAHRLARWRRRKLPDLIGPEFHPPSGMGKMPARSGWSGVDGAANGTAIEAEEEPELGVCGVGPVVHQEGRQVVGQREGELAPGPRLTLACGPFLPLGVGMPAARFEYGQELVERRGADPGELPERVQDSLQAARVALAHKLRTPIAMVQRL